MATLAAGAAGEAIGQAAPRRLRFIALGQAAIQHDLREHPYEEYGRIARLLKVRRVLHGPRNGDRGAGRGTVYRKDSFQAASIRAGVPRGSVNLLALSNNHSWDSAPEALSTLNAVRGRGFSFAGTGSNLADASMPGYRVTPAGTIALVSMASGAIREGAAATDSRPGVNEVRLEADGELNADDTERNLGAIRAAARRAAHVFVYQHNHYWETNFRDTPGWQRRWARQCIDAGACAYVSHGAPLLQGSTSTAAPVFYDLSSIVFHCARRWEYRPRWGARSPPRFDAGRLAALGLTPVLLNEAHLSGALLRNPGAPLPGVKRRAASWRLQRLSPRIELRRGEMWAAL
jgi:poly-gamma-glutamate synthesis protein (capsule biosynthesis protein)